MNAAVETASATIPAQIHSGILRRDRLFRVLDSNRPSLCVLSATSGFGKTTVVRDWIDSYQADSSTRIIWVPLIDEIPSELAFWEAVAMAAERAGAMSAEQVDDIIAGVDSPAVTVRAMARALPVHGNLVLDAFENAGAFTEALSEQLVNLTRLSPDLHVIITTRAADLIATPSRVLRNQVRLVGPDELAFTQDEVSLLFKHVGRAGQAKEVFAATRGYPLAVRAASMSIRDEAGDLPTPATLASPVWPDMVAEHLRHQLNDPALLEFIQLCVISPFVDEELATEITGSPDALAQLETIQNQGFGRWIPFAAGREVFQFVDAFRETMLRSVRAGALPKDVRDKAATTSAYWLMRNGMREQALALAIEGNAFALAETITVELVQTVPEMYITNRMGMLLSRVPARALGQHPIMAFALGLAHMTDPLMRASALQYFDIVNTKLSTRAPHPDQRLTLTTILSVSQRLSGQYEAAGDTAMAGWEIFRGLSMPEREMLGTLAPIALRALSYSVLQAGNAERAAEMARAALPSSGTAAEHNYTLAFVSGIDGIQGHGRLAAEARDRLDATAWPRRHDNTYMNLLGKVGAAFLALDDFDWQGAIEQVAFDESRIDTAEFWPFVCVPIMRARMALGQAATEARRVDDALTASFLPPGVGENLGTADLYNELALLWLAAGNPARAQEVMSRETDFSAQFASARMLLMLLRGDPQSALREASLAAKAPGHTARSLSAMALLAAAAAARTDQMALASTRLDDVWAAYIKHGIRSCSVLLPEEDRVRLRAMAKHTAIDFDRLVPPSLAIPFTQLPESVDLSAREQAVLALLASGQTPTIAQIAEELFVSPNTVKTQLRSLYRKLGVDARDKAVRRAFELGLL